MGSRRAIALLAAGVGLLYTSEPVTASTALQRITERPAEGLAETVEADAAELLALAPEAQANLRRWLRRGGSLRLTGDVVTPALPLFGGAEATIENGRLAVGLGLVMTVGTDAATSLPPGDDLREAASRLARSRLPERQRIGRSDALKLLVFVILLVVGLLASRRAPRRWRFAGALSLVAVFGSWPAWSRLAPSADRWHQVDVVVDTAAEGPALRWSAAVLLAAGRHPLEVRPGAGAWGVRLSAETSAAPAEDSAPVSLLRAVRGERFELSWLSDDDGEAALALELVRRGDRLVGFVRNRSARGWRDVRLLLPGRGVLPLEDLPPGEARMLELALPAEVLRSPSTDVALPPRRARLMDAVLRTAGRSLLDRQRPVLVAWADGSVRPPSFSRPPRQHGTTLLLVAARSSK